eukprot:jgi/Undpi1/8075/HiC_scaffold_24.g10547.m1
MPTGEEARRALRVGDVVERDIDGIWFPAKVLAVHDNSKQAKPERGSITWCLAYDLVYLDDDNRESEEEQEQRSRNDDKLPKVSIHSSHGTFDSKDDGSSTAYIINGPETNVAAGSGLRGIRWLRGP